MKINEKIRKLLPEGLEKETIDAIGKLFSNDLSEAVKQVKDEASAKVYAFLRANMDSIKESALAELELENETYRKAKLFESVSNIMATEITDEDYESSMSVAYSEASELNEQLSFITKELNNVLKENKKLSSSVQALHESNSKLKAQVKAGSNKLQESVGRFKELKAQKEQRLSDKAQVYSQETIIAESRGNTENPLLDDEVLKLFPKR